MATTGKILSDREVRHLPTVGGVRIGRIQTVEVDGKVYECRLFYDSNANLHHVESSQI
jgi:hypothetical protein